LKNTIISQTCVRKLIKIKGLASYYRKLV